MDVKPVLTLDNLPPEWANESWLYQTFVSAQVTGVKLIRGRTTCAHLEFASHAAAQACLEAYAGTMAPGTQLVLDLKWPSSEAPNTGEGERSWAGGEELGAAAAAGHAAHTLADPPARVCSRLSCARTALARVHTRLFLLLQSSRPSWATSAPR